MTLFALSTGIHFRARKISPTRNIFKGNSTSRRPLIERSTDPVQPLQTDAVARERITVHKAPSG